jgi:hypothetical protein
LIVKKSLIALAVLASTTAFAGNDVPGNCGQGSGSGNACLPTGTNTVTNTKNVTSNNVKTINKATTRNVTRSVTSPGPAPAVPTTASVGGNTVAIQHERNPVSTAYAPGLTASNGTCMGSSSGGAQGGGLGISMGTTWNDENCDRRYDAGFLMELGQDAAALALLCQKQSIADAMKAAGRTCPTLPKSAQPVTARRAAPSNDPAANTWLP